MSGTNRADSSADIPVVKATGVEEVLAYIPHTLGFQPEESVVLISLRPPRGRLGLTIRCNLTDLACSAAPELLSQLARHLRSDGAEHVFCAVYVPGTVAQARADPRVRAAVAAVEAAPRMPGVRDTWLVTPSGYGGFSCENETCCPPGGRDLRELDSTRVAAELALRGSAPKARRRDLVPPRVAGTAARRSFAAAYGRTLDEVDRARDIVGERSAETDAPHAAYAAELYGSLTSPVPKPSGLGRIAALLSVPLVRDAVLLRLLSPEDGDECAEGARDGHLDGDLASRISAVLRHGASDPDLEQIDGAAAVVSAAAAFAKPSVRADLCAVLGWLSWWRGDGARASVAVQEAMAITPTHRLATLVDELLRRRASPGWTRRAAAG